MALGSSDSLPLPLILVVQSLRPECSVLSLIPSACRGDSTDHAFAVTQGIGAFRAVALISSLIAHSIVQQVGQLAAQGRTLSPVPMQMLRPEMHESSSIQIPVQVCAALHRQFRMRMTYCTTPLLAPLRSSCRVLMPHLCCCAQPSLSLTAEPRPSKSYRRAQCWLVGLDQGANCQLGSRSHPHGCAAVLRQLSTVVPRRTAASSRHRILGFRGSCRQVDAGQHLFGATAVFTPVARRRQRPVSASSASPCTL